MSPTIINIDGFRLYFYSNEGFEPPHVHIQLGSASAKFWIKPVALAKNNGLKAMELRKASVLIEKNEYLIEGAWNEYFSRKR